MSNLTGGSIVWNLDVKDTGLSSGLSDAKNKIDDLSKEANKSFERIGEGIGKVGKKMTLFVTGPILAVGGAALKLAADFEQSNVAFTTMLGSADKAQKLLSDLADFAIKTPFTLKGIEDTTKQLLAMGIEETKLLPTVKALGDVSSGLSTDLDRLAYNFGQVKSQGKLTGVELRDFTRAGVPLIAELSKNLNVSETAIKDMVSASEIGFDSVEKAFITMSSEGGKFNDMMAVQSLTTAGQFSNLKDQVSLLGREVGKQLLPPAISLTKELIKLVEKLNTINPETIKLIIGIGGVVAIIGPLLIAISSIIKSITVIGTAIKSLGAVFTVVKVVGGAVATAIGAISAPVLIVIGIITALIGIGVLLWKNWDTIKEKTIQIWDSIVNFFKALPERISQVWDAIINGAIAFFKFYLSIYTYWIPHIIGYVIGWFITLPGKIKESFDTMIANIKTWGSNTWSYLSNQIPIWINNIINWFTSLPGRLGSGLSSLGSTIRNAFVNAWNYLSGEISQWPGRIWDWGRNIANSFVEGFKNALGSIGRAFTDGINNAKRNMQGDSPPKEGPLKEIDKWGFNIGEAWVSGFAGSIGKLSSIVNQSLSSLQDVMGYGGMNMAGVDSNGGNTQNVNINGVTIQDKGDIDALVRQLGFKLTTI